ALLKQVGSVIGRFDLVRHGMRERALCKIASVAMFTSTIAEAAAESVRRGDASGGITLRLNAAQKGR
ncbi:hypothetical protein, partial [Caballeronia catudaia]|uniref:hypothetical protein n=1 Tax=Caballeronia catudaia TaxID=1777136 RepID=UPI001F16DDCB